MEEAGEVLRLAKSGRLIIRAKADLDIGTVLVDREGKRLAKVIDLIGPTRSPYASAVLLTDMVNKASCSKVYVLRERSDHGRGKKRRRSS